MLGYPHGPTDDDALRRNNVRGEVLKLLARESALGLDLGPLKTAPRPTRLVETVAVRLDEVVVEDRARLGVLARQQHFVNAREQGQVPIDAHGQGPVRQFCSATDQPT